MSMYYVGKAFGAVAAPAMVAVGACANLIFKDFVDDRLKSNRHDISKKIEKFFIGYDPESKESIDLLVSVFSNIFAAFNLQVSLFIITVLKYLLISYK
jgi:hypothetical protein